MNDAQIQLTNAEFRERFEILLSEFSKTGVLDYAFVDIPSNRKPWLNSGIDLTDGENVTTFAVGQTRLLGTDLWFGADFQVWFRIGSDGEIFRGTRASNSFSVTRPGGRLYLASYFPGEWSTRSGELETPDAVYEQASGELTVAIVRWRLAPLEGLKRLAAQGDAAALVAGEVERLTCQAPVPQGWHYLWFVGPAEIYRPGRTPERESAICCATRRDAGLLQKDVVLPFEPNTCLHWDWRVDLLPSEVREDSLSTHDYLSIAVEFDNGQDITYFWSAELPAGAAFRCPIPSWATRETHVAIRSGSEGLGRWFSEKRDVYRDYQQYIGGDLPARIVRVWLIAVSLFQGREGKCLYDNIYFEHGGRTVPVR